MSGLSPGMKSLMQILETTAVNMGIDLGCGNIGVAEHHLHRPEIGPMLQKMGGKRVAQNMRADFLTDANLQTALSDNLPETQPRHACSSIGDKKKIAEPGLEEFCPACLEINTDMIFCRLSKGYQPFPPALAQHTDMAIGKGKTGNRQMNQLRDPHARGIEEMEHSSVAQGKHGPLFRPVKKQADLANR